MDAGARGDQLSQPLPSLLILVSLYEALVQYKIEASVTTMKDRLSAAVDFAESMNRVALSKEKSWTRPRL